MTKENEELEPENLRYSCDCDIFEFESTKELDELDKVISQDRAVEAINFGLDIESEGYNLYVAGIAGTGKRTIVRNLVEKIASNESTPDDWCYVYNFEEEDKPIAVNLPSGMGCEFKEDMEHFVSKIRTEIPKAFNSEEYQKKKREIKGGIQQKKQKHLDELEDKAREMGFELKNTERGVLTLAIVDGETVPNDELDQLPEEKQEEIEEKREVLQEDIRETFHKLRKIDQDAKEQIEELNRDTALWTIGHLIDDLMEKYCEISKVQTYLENVKTDIIENVRNLIDNKPGGNNIPSFMQMMPQQQEDPYKKYRVNLLVDNCETDGSPVVEETHPTYYNLVGRIERESQYGTLQTDFSMIKSGSLLESSGGYLIVRAEDVFRYPSVWPALKKAIMTKEVNIEDMAEQMGYITPVGLKPEPIPVDLKVVMIGSPRIYHILHNYEEDFRKMFKTKADFDHQMDKNETYMKELAQFITKRCNEESLNHFTPEAVGSIAEYSSRLVSHQEKLSLRFSEVTDIIRESSYWSEQDEEELVEEEHVKKAIDKKEYRSNLPEERIQELIEEEVILVDTDGDETGQINGLSVYNLGDFSFGKPSRITAEISMGEKGVVNIEREVDLSGSAHDKGVLILSGFLAGKFAQDKPLTLSASICFEQSYGEIDGDSASSTELYAILSGLAKVPIKQGIAVTGSVNQKGIIQPIGGVNQKIEGFFETCKAKGLTGDQGVLIPHQNIENLMLKNKVIEAAESGDFHIYPVKTIEEGIEILMGMKAGSRNEDGEFPEGTLFRKVDDNLRKMAEDLKSFGGGDKED